jgi:hypothetical protein
MTLTGSRNDFNPAKRVKDIGIYLTIASVLLGCLWMGSRIYGFIGKKC